MNKIVLYCKSYWKDIPRVKILLESIAKYNKESIPFYISCPRKDRNQFIKELGISGYTLIDDETIYDHGSGENWNNQQVVKSSFWKLGVCDNYLMIDSDSYFIRDFFVSDFIHPDGNPYTVMHEQKELFSWTINKELLLGFDPIQSFKECRYKIMEVFQRSGRVYDFGPSPVIWNCGVWKWLEDNYLIPQKMNFSDAIESVPSEFSWYGESFLEMGKPLYPIEPLFKVFHYESQYKDSKNQGYSEKNFSSIYSGIVMQSNANIPLKY